jgi:hypothetical protein
VSARRPQRGKLDIFAESAGESNALSLQETDASIFGATLPDPDTGRQVAKPISIFEIYPDVTQPRRAIPSPVRPYWDGKPATTSALFQSWYHLAVQERGHEFQLDAYILASDVQNRPDVVGPIEAALIEVIDLAANIRAHGLTYPITVARTPQGYRLETGERRWLAYHFLNMYFQAEAEQWSRIPARPVPEFSVWRQASENNARANLNAISRARQLAILMMHVYQELGYSFQSYEQAIAESGCDRAFYAQVADGDDYKVPPGKTSVLNTAIGVKSDSQFREYRALLRLPDEVWRIADDLNWTQGKIRGLERRSAGSLNLLISRAYQQAEAEKYRVGIPTLPSPFEEVRGDQEPETGPFSPDTLKRYGRVLAFAKRVGQGTGRIKERDILEIEYMRKWLLEVEAAARKQMKNRSK